jgi:hypothetical protein
LEPAKLRREAHGNRASDALGLVIVDLNSHCRSPFSRKPPLGSQPGRAQSGGQGLRSSSGPQTQSKLAYAERFAAASRANRSMLLVSTLQESFRLIGLFADLDPPQDFVLRSDKIFSK